jgi:LysM repeat protein
MYQQVGGLRPGARVRFSVYMQAWTNSTNALTSDRNQPMNMRVGIDPNGGTDPFSGNVIWSGIFDSYDVYDLYSIEAVARNSTVTVFTRSTPLWGVQHNDVYIDDASLVVVGAGTTTSGTTTSAPPPPGPTVAPTPPPGFPYVVVPGDNYYRVARKFGISLAALFQANPTATPNLLKVGQVLIIPGISGGSTTTGGTTVGTTPTVAPPAPTAAPPANAFTYVVQRGDNLYRLSIRFNTTIARIMELNHLTGYIIYIGQTLIIAP